MKLIKQGLYSSFGREYLIRVYKGKYPVGNAIALLSQSEIPDMPGCYEPFMTFSVNLPNAPQAPEETYIKHWSENQGAVAWLQQHGVIAKEASLYVQSGFVMVGRYKVLL